MAVRRAGLGKGLDSLIPSNSSIKTKSSNETRSEQNTENVRTVEKVVEKIVEKPADVYLNINQIEPNRKQPRKNFDEDALVELADSIKQFGIIQPLVVQKKNKYYEIIAGERRWRAAKLAGLKKVPVVIKEFSDQEIVEISLIENIQRENLNPIEEAIAFKRLIEEFSLKQDEVAERVSKSRAAVTNSIRLLKLTDKVQQMVVDDMISTGHARALIGIEDPKLQYSIAMRVVDEKLSVRDTEKMVKDILNPRIQKKKDKRLVGYEIFAVIAAVFSVPLVFYVNTAMLGADVILVDAQSNLMISNIILSSIFALVIMRMLRRM